MLIKQKPCGLLPKCFFSDKIINILPKYHKQIAGLQYTYGGYEGAECNFIDMEDVVCIILILIDTNKDVQTLVVKDRDALDKHMDCEMKCRGLCSEGRGR